MSGKDRAKSDKGLGSGGVDDEDREGRAAVETEGKCKGCGRKDQKLPFFRLKKTLVHQKRKQRCFLVNSRGRSRPKNSPKTLDSSGLKFLHRAAGEMNKARVSDKISKIWKFSLS